MNSRTLKQARRAALASLLGLASCQRPGLQDHSRVLARVGGQPITSAALRYYLRVRAHVAPLPEDASKARALALDEMINTQILANTAEKEHLDHDPGLHFALTQDRLNLLAHALVTRYLKRHPVTSAELAAAYHQRFQDGGVTEYRARHILVRSPAEARAIIRKLKAGAHFATLARTLSSDTISAQNGGELGWFTKDQMLPAFVRGVASLKPGAISPEPIRTEFGWHVVQLEGRRVTPAPPFGKERRALYRAVVAEKLTALLTKLRAITPVKITGAPVIPAPPDHSLPALSVPPGHRLADEAR